MRWPLPLLIILLSLKISYGYEKCLTEYRAKVSLFNKDRSRALKMIKIIEKIQKGEEITRREFPKLFNYSKGMNLESVSDREMTSYLKILLKNDLVCNDSNQPLYLKNFNQSFNELMSKLVIFKAQDTTFTTSVKQFQAERDQLLNLSTKFSQTQSIAEIDDLVDQARVYAEKIAEGLDEKNKALLELSEQNEDFLNILKYIPDSTAEKDILSSLVTLRTWFASFSAQKQMEEMYKNNQEIFFHIFLHDPKRPDLLQFVEKYLSNSTFDQPAIDLLVRSMRQGIIPPFSLTMRAISNTLNISQYKDLIETSIRSDLEHFKANIELYTISPNKAYINGLLWPIYFENLLTNSNDEEIDQFLQLVDDETHRSNFIKALVEQNKSINLNRIISINNNEFYPTALQYFFEKNFTLYADDYNLELILEKFKNLIQKLKESEAFSDEARDILFKKFIPLALNYLPNGLEVYNLICNFEFTNENMPEILNYLINNKIQIDIDKYLEILSKNFNADIFFDYTAFLISSLENSNHCKELLTHLQLTSQSKLKNMLLQKLFELEKVNDSKSIMALIGTELTIDEIFYKENILNILINELERSDQKMATFLEIKKNLAPMVNDFNLLEQFEGYFVDHYLTQQASDPQGLISYFAQTKLTITQKVEMLEAMPNIDIYTLLNILGPYNNELDYSKIILKSIEVSEKPPLKQIEKYRAILHDWSDQQKILQLADQKILAEHPLSNTELTIYYERIKEDDYRLKNLFDQLLQTHNPLLLNNRVLANLSHNIIKWNEHKEDLEGIIRNIYTIQTPYPTLRASNLILFLEKITFDKEHLYKMILEPLGQNPDPDFIKNMIYYFQNKKLLDRKLLQLINVQAMALIKEDPSWAQALNIDLKFFSESEAQKIAWTVGQNSTKAADIVYLFDNLIKNKLTNIKDDFKRIIFSRIKETDLQIQDLIKLAEDYPASLHMARAAISSASDYLLFNTIEINIDQFASKRPNVDDIKSLVAQYKGDPLYLVRKIIKYEENCTPEILSTLLDLFKNNKEVISALLNYHEIIPLEVWPYQKMQTKQIITISDSRENFDDQILIYQKLTPQQKKKINLKIHSLDQSIKYFCAFPHKDEFKKIIESTDHFSQEQIEGLLKCTEVPFKLLAKKIDLAQFIYNIEDCSLLAPLATHVPDSTAMKIKKVLGQFNSKKVFSLLTTIPFFLNDLFYDEIYANYLDFDDRLRIYHLYSNIELAHRWMIDSLKTPSEVMTFTKKFPTLSIPLIDRFFYLDPNEDDLSNFYKLFVGQLTTNQKLNTLGVHMAAMLYAQILENIDSPTFLYFLSALHQLNNSLPTILDPVKTIIKLALHKCNNHLHVWKYKNILDKFYPKLLDQDHELSELIRNKIEATRIDQSHIMQNRIKFAAVLEDIEHLDHHKTMKEIKEFDDHSKLKDSKKKHTPSQSYYLSLFRDTVFKELKMDPKARMSKVIHQLDHHHECGVQDSNPLIRRNFILQSIIPIVNALTHCKICLEDQQDGYQCPCCNLNWCTECLKRQVTMQTDENTFPFICTNGSCNAPLKIEGANLEALGLTIDELERRIILSTPQEHLFRYPHGDYCQNPLCINIYNQKANPACPTCNFTTWEVERDPAELALEEKATKDYLHQNETLFRKCPNCGRRIFRYAGCNDVICGKDTEDEHSTYIGKGCGHRFDWTTAEKIY